MNAAGNRRWLSSLVRYGLLIGGMALVVIPFLYMLSTSLKPPAYTLELPPRLIPNPLTLDNYKQVLPQKTLWTYLVNSLFVAVVSTRGTVAISALMAYAFALMRFPGKGLIFSILLIGMMIPPVMLIIPQFLV